MVAFEKWSLYIFMSVFGGSTLLLFLICLCCQRKLQARTLAMADITNIESQHARQAERRQRRSDTHNLIVSMVTPPPDYATVIKKDSLCGGPEPPAYDVAMAELRSVEHI